ncbi:hypothetical protein [Halalkalibacter akibai]|uniref:Uncharacterized protein n=1 Tax=Halalkalibacter akibai (strain ATCC 43226 / DSM 21942 / CIP 109018 / JCM 9157 / 1139) TaxID=1236973 RepID=W4QVP3_HALA3|nr:hypothetical protein [Halalkalibacter akibai]GAE35703.1 hypothetical protein JCM9157_2823 [Halalkalibacter akibai JCM 9157]
MKPIPEFILLNKYSDISFGLKDFLKGEISEEEYINTRKDASGRLRYPWPELIFLKSDMTLYGEYLLKFSLVGRRTVLLVEESIGFKKTELYDFYSIPSDTIGRYLRRAYDTKKSKHPPRIRNMTTLPPTVSREVIAFFALLARVPISWLIHEKPDLEWSVDYFDYLPHTKKLSLSEFKSYLKNFPVNIQHDVSGIIINVGVKFPLYIRLESIYGGFIIEVFNPNFGLNDIFILRELLKDFYYIEEGYMGTVIESHKNYTFIVNKKNMKPLCIPMEFKRFSNPTTL